MAAILLLTLLPIGFVLPSMVSETQILDVRIFGKRLVGYRTEVTEAGVHFGDDVNGVQSSAIGLADWGWILFVFHDENDPFADQLIYLRKHE